MRSARSGPAFGSGRSPASADGAGEVQGLVHGGLMDEPDGERVASGLPAAGGHGRHDAEDPGEQVEHESDAQGRARDNEQAELEVESLDGLVPGEAGAAVTGHQDHGQRPDEVSGGPGSAGPPPARPWGGRWGWPGATGPTPAARRS